MSRLVRRALLGVVLGALIYLVAVLYVDIAAMRSALADFRWSAVGLALLLSSVNYLLRFWKWELCLGWLGIREPGPGNAPGLTRGRSLLIYIAGLSMSVTPGKVGEVLRSGRTLSERVTLRAGERAVAHGDLVDVDGELGVQITEIVGNP